ncbi:hypothetical protein MELA_00861 [Candidatus Methylomirabilis lanthanidiphila]|uniref:Uncharacterized protein n=1 Tax=Candidatus Methylomirabilis lanthanidiphila TaxID=2211376 RepID=A0A564ZIX4_9BACT|nr:hypothetical protein [Candidatus Methylomirabilis lanthanidiphila]VUZ84488.1 hypothetical protein MELA_00861 [Candidatus Methylomirabilis lanthanidiphila]
MGTIEISTPEREKALAVLLDAVERQKRLLSQSIGRTQERIQRLAASLQVNPDLLLAGEVPRPEAQDMDLLELEGELDLLRHLRDQLASLEHLTICS